MTFLKSYQHIEMPLHLVYMVYLTKFTKNVPKLANFFSKFLKLVLKDGKFPFNSEVLKRYAFPKLAIFLRKNSPNFVQ